MGGGDCGVVPYKMRRFVLEGVDVKVVANSTMVLAAKRTHRKNPLDNFNYYNYKGGWNITEKHYFSKTQLNHHRRCNAPFGFSGFCVMADSCVAMDQWVQCPTAHTALDDIIPCVDRATAQEALNESKDVTTHLVGIVNAFINNVANLNITPSSSHIYYNQSGPPVPVLYSPYNPDKTDRKCDADEVNFNNAPQEWKKYLCQVSACGVCIIEG